MLSANIPILIKPKIYKLFLLNKKKLLIFKENCE